MSIHLMLIFLDVSSEVVRHGSFCGRPVLHKVHTPDRIINRTESLGKYFNPLFYSFKI